MTLRMLVHNKVHLALHELRGPLADGQGARPLLLLHGLGERSPSSVPSWAAVWPGPRCLPPIKSTNLPTLDTMPIILSGFG